MKKQNNLNVAYATFSISLVLLLSAIFIIIFLHSNNISNILKEKLSVIVELNSREASDVNDIISILLSKEEVIASSVKIVKSEEALDIMELDNEVIENIGNPFLDVLSFNIKSQFYTDEFLTNVSDELMKIDIVNNVFYENNTIENLKSNIRYISFFIFFLAIIFLILAIIIIYNTISMKLYADRWEIKTMQMIGAKDSFIRMPYLHKARIIAWRSFLISFFGVFLVLGILLYYSDIAMALIRWEFFLVTIVIILLIAFLITGISTFNAVNKYLNRPRTELYS